MCADLVIQVVSDCHNGDGSSMSLLLQVPLCVLDVHAPSEFLAFDLFHAYNCCVKERWWTVYNAVHSRTGNRLSYGKLFKYQHDNWTASQIHP